MPLAVSLYDKTGISLKPWANAGYTCICFDIQHVGVTVSESGIVMAHADLYNVQTLLRLVAQLQTAHFLSAYPPCTDLAVSGARWFKAKAVKDPTFQLKATAHASNCEWFAKQLGARFYVENPISRLSSLWRKPDHIFNPCEYGGYLPADDAHPQYPGILPPRDAYKKKTCLWSGGGFTMPVKKPVPPENYSGFNMVGGSSLHTKNVRSATPRGFAQAVFLANS